VLLWVLLLVVRIVRWEWMFEREEVELLLKSESSKEATNS
jgi:hypothetical protein